MFLTQCNKKWSCSITPPLPVRLTVPAGSLRMGLGKIKLDWVLHYLKNHQPDYYFSVLLGLRGWPFNPLFGFLVFSKGAILLLTEFCCNKSCSKQECQLSRMGKLECRWPIICSPTSFVLLPLLAYLLRSLPLTFVLSCLMQSWHRASSRKCLTTAQHKKCKTICTHYCQE